MSDEVYEQLAGALDRLPNGFPRTPSNVELLLLKKIFSPEEASLAIRLSGNMEPVDAIADRLELPVEEARAKLMGMVKSGLLWYDKEGGKPRFRLAPFIVGIFESQLESMDHEFAHLFEEYMADGGAAGIMRPQPAMHRVIPAQGAVKSEWILPYDDVRSILLAAKSFSVRDCICRVQQDQVGRKCDFPLKNCLMFSPVERKPRPGDISKEEALAILDETEEIGLVHTVSNVAEQFGYVCNCCGCCCAILRGITDWGVEKSVAYANYYSVIDADECTGCGACVERCQVNAVSENDEVTVVDQKACIGCGLCVTGCPTEAAKLLRKPDDEIVPPPVDFATWEQERLRNRGLIE
ncbi:MAG: 4Fe-4S binding protein [Candidatus Zixiibacteriota bacterium]